MAGALEVKNHKWVQACHIHRCRARSGYHSGMCQLMDHQLVDHQLMDHQLMDHQLMDHQLMDHQLKS